MKLRCIPRDYVGEAWEVTYGMCGVAKVEVLGPGPNSRMKVRGTTGNYTSRNRLFRTGLEAEFFLANHHLTRTQKEFDRIQHLAAEASKEYDFWRLRYEAIKEEGGFDDA